MPILTPAERLESWVGARYQLQRIIGQGASAVLFAARDRLLEREVAVKVMRPEGGLGGEQHRARFAAEAQLLARIRHPHLVDVFDVGETDDGLPYVVMELLRGETLADRLDRDGTLDIEEALRVVLPLMGALASAHDVGVIHRDIKPANIFLHRTSAERAVPKLLDFGIARVTSAAGMTSSGIALGTPAFMAPEQARGEPLGPAADVWAMGITLYRCLIGRLPFEAPTAAGVLVEATTQGAPRIHDAMPTLDVGLSVAIERAMEPRLARRHADMRAFAEALVRTAARAGLRVPASPDPVGLHAYERWCLEAQSEEHTAAQPVASVSAIESSGQRKAQGVKLRGHAVLGAIALLVAGALVTWTAGGTTNAEPRVQPAIVTKAVPAAPPIAVEPAVGAPPSPAVAGQTPLAAPPHDAPLRAPPRKAVVKGREKREFATPNDRMNEAPALTPTEGTKTRLVEDWSW